MNDLDDLREPRRANERMAWAAIEKLNSRNQQMKTEHKYAQVLRWIADGEDVQWQSVTGEWRDQGPRVTLTDVNGEDYPLDRYRVKPRTVQIGSRMVEAPVLEPVAGQEIWICAADGEPQAYAGGGYHPISYCAHHVKNGKAFASAEAARAAHEAIAALLRGES